mgnify:CR=1 FL=1
MKHLHCKIRPDTWGTEGPHGTIDGMRITPLKLNHAYSVEGRRRYSNGAVKVQLGDEHLPKNQAVYVSETQVEYLTNTK